MVRCETSVLWVTNIARGLHYQKPYEYIFPFQQRKINFLPTDWNAVTSITSICLKGHYTMHVLYSEKSIWIIHRKTEKVSFRRKILRDVWLGIQSWIFTFVPCHTHNLMNHHSFNKFVTHQGKCELQTRQDIKKRLWKVKNDVITFKSILLFFGWIFLSHYSKPMQA